jgi:hypothetical protein
MSANLFIRCTHTGFYADGRPNTASVFLSDIDMGAEFQTRKTRQYVPAGGFIDIALSDRNLHSFYHGGIAAFVAQGILRASLFTQPEIYTNITRPNANLYPVGCSIWNTDDNALNWSDGALWRDASGLPT